MKMGRVISLLAMSIALAAPQSLAADIAKLEWGAFVVTEDSSNGWSNTRSLSSDDGRSVTITLSSFEAKVEDEGATKEAGLEGRYELFQPPGERIAACRVDIEGLIVKSGATTARINVKLGSAEQTIEWTPEDASSDKFRKTLTFATPENGTLPSPLDVGIEAVVRKDGKDGVAFVSVTTVTVTAEWTKLAGR